MTFLKSGWKFCKWRRK